MSGEFLGERGRGPEILGPRLTVYHLMPYFLDPDVTEEHIGRTHGLTAEQVAAARAYVLSHPETVLATHRKIEERIAAGNPPQVRQAAEKTRAEFLRFRQWLEERNKNEQANRACSSAVDSDKPGTCAFPTFDEWMKEQESRSTEGS